MLIVKREEFVRMPAGTIFAPWRPNCFMAGFEIKVDPGRLYPDYGWVYSGTMPLEPWLEDFVGPGQNDVDFQVYDGYQNDVAEYEYIAVLERKDIENLIGKLQWALNGCPYLELITGEEKKADV